MILRLKIIVTNIVWLTTMVWVFLSSDWLRENILAAPVIVMGLLLFNYLLWQDELRNIRSASKQVDNRATASKQHDAMIDAGLQQIRQQPQGSLTQALKNLSDEELIRLKTRLQDGTIDDAMLVDEIQKQKRS